LIDAETKEILYTVRANGKTFTPGAPAGRVFIIKAGQDAPTKIVARAASVGTSVTQAVSLK
jgi:hypothetical protein